MKMVSEVMTVTSLINFLKSQNPEEFKKNIQRKSFQQQIIDKLKLDKSSTLNDIANALLIEARKLLDKEDRANALLILKRVKSLLPLVDKQIYVSFYLALASSFILNNEYEGANQAAEKARKMAYALKDPKLIIKSLNMLFAIHRTIQKDKAMKYLIKSQQIAEKYNLYDNIVYTEVNIGLMHLFNRKITEAAESCKKVVDIISSHPYPNDKIHMPADFFLHLFNENQGLVVAPKYKDTVIKGIRIVLRAAKQIKNLKEKARRLSILIMLLKMSDEILEQSLKEILSFIEEQKDKEKSVLYAAVANGLGDYKGYKTALSVFHRALKKIDKAEDDEQLRIRKNYAYLLSSALNISMVYDLASSTSEVVKLKDLKIKTNQTTLLGKPGVYHKYRSAITDSDAIFGVTRKDIKKKLIVSIKEQYTKKQAISEFYHEKGSTDLIKNVELIAINALNQKGELQSLLLSGSLVDEKTFKRKKRIFNGYQIIGHIVPNSILSQKHFEDFDIVFLHDLIKAPQKFKTIELLSVDEALDVNYEPILE